MPGLKIALRAAISVALLVVLLANVDTSQVGAALIRADLGWFGLAVVAALGSWSVNTAKWQGLLATLGRRLPYRYLFALNFIGLFYSVLLPGQIGGEVMKGIRLVRGGADTRDAAVSISADRLTGLTGLGVIAVGGLLLAQPVPATSPILALAVAAAALGMLPFWVMKWPLFARLRLAERPVGKTAVFVALLHAIVAQALVTLSNYFVALSVGVDIPLVALAWIVASVSLVHLVPISLAGLGLREGAYVLLLQQYHVPTTEGLALSLAVFAVIMTLALLGGLLELFWSGIGPRLLASDGHSERAVAAGNTQPDSALRSE